MKGGTAGGGWENSSPEAAGGGGAGTGCSLSLPRRPGLGTWLMDFLPAQSQFSFSKACHRKRAGMLSLSFGDTTEDSQVGNSVTIL